MRNRAWIVGLGLLAGAGAAPAQPVAPAGGIYACVDARGRNLTSDRPIPECLDREQRELNPSGSTRRRIEPSYTAHELAEREQRAREAAQRDLRRAEERRRERALLLRYPSAEAHQRARDDALAQIDALIQLARKRLDELAAQRRPIDDELEFYKAEPDKAPPALRRQVSENAQSAAVQLRFIAEQEEEKKRVAARFDEEGRRLRVLWSAAGTTGTAAP